jgi:NarL family two-component system response regulator LiaR
MSRRTVRVLLVDDHELARRGFESMLATADWVSVVGYAEDCPGALAQAAALKPDVVLLDVRMPGEDGLSCLPKLRVALPEAAVIMVTLYDGRSYLIEAIRKGAAGYLLKDASSREVLETIAQVADGQLAIDPQLLRDALTAMPDEELVERPSARAQYGLTNREMDVLALVAEGFTNKEIGAQLQIAEDTAKKHVQNVIWKLHAADRTQAAVIALREGLLEPVG